MNDDVTTEVAGQIPDLGILDEARLDAVLALWRAAGKRTVLLVAGGSMRPFIHPGWKLVLDHTAARHPFGAIIVFLQGRMLVAHRVVGQDRHGGYLTKGDAILHLDGGSVDDSNVVGRVVAVQYGGRERSLPTGRGGRAVVVASLSRLVAEMNQICRLLRWLSSPAGRLVGRLPGPTRVLNAANRLVMSGVSRAMGREDTDDSDGASG